LSGGIYISLCCLKIWTPLDESEKSALIKSMPDSELFTETFFKGVQVRQSVCSEKGKQEFSSYSSCYRLNV